MSRSDEDYEAEAARQEAETCEHGISLSVGPACRECDEDDSIPEGWAITGCAYCQAPMGPECQKGGCCSGCRHAVQPKGRGYRMVQSKHSTRPKMVPEFFDLETGEAI